MIQDHPAHVAPPPKFCKDCKHFTPNPHVSKASAEEYAFCERVALAVSFVTGSPQRSDTAMCAIQRTSGCGPEARYFEPREESVVDTLRSEGGL